MCLSVRLPLLQCIYFTTETHTHSPSVFRLLFAVHPDGQYLIKVINFVAAPPLQTQEIRGKDHQVSLMSSDNRREGLRFVVMFIKGTGVRACVRACVRVCVCAVYMKNFESDMMVLALLFAGESTRNLLPSRTLSRR